MCPKSRLDLICELGLVSGRHRRHQGCVTWFRILELAEGRKKISWFVGCFLSEDADGNGGGRRGAEEEEEKEKEREGGDDDSFRASVSTLLLLFLPWFWSSLCLHLRSKISVLLMFLGSSIAAFVSICNVGGVPLALNTSLKEHWAWQQWNKCRQIHFLLYLQQLPLYSICKSCYAHSFFSC